MKQEGPLGASALPLLTLTRIWPVCVLSHVRLIATPWTVACQALPSVEFTRQEYRSGLPFPPPGDLLTQGSNRSLLSPALAGRFCTTAPPGKPHIWHTVRYMQSSEPTANTLMSIQLPWDILLAAKFASGRFFSDEILIPSLCKSCLWTRYN